MKRLLPPVSSGLTGPDWVEPPFHFEGVIMRVFPLRASLYALQSFVDRYLHAVFPAPGEVKFRAFIPYVYLMMVDYGRMSLEAANMGWISQRELLFNIPLEWYEPSVSGFVFRDFAQLSPYVFVDNEFSMSLGRESIGWPKKLARWDAPATTGMENPHLPIRLASLSANGFAQPIDGKQEPNVFLEVLQTPASAFLEWPVASAALTMPWMMANNLAQYGAAWVQDYLQIMGGLSLTRQWGMLSPFSSSGMAQSLSGLMRPDRPDLTFNCITLKQFRDADDPRYACYQALVNSPMSVKRLDSAGLLGEPHQLRGDFSGGYRIRLTPSPLYSIVERLGLQVESQDSLGGTTVSTLKPVFPYWTQVDMTYGRAQLLKQRVNATASAAGKALQDDTLRIRTSDGTAAHEISGPFHFPNASLRVLPLLAQRQKLQAFCDELLNQSLASPLGTQVRFEPWGEYVYVVIASYEQIFSANSATALPASSLATWYLPVFMYVSEKTPEGASQERLRTVALVPIHNFSNSSALASSASEVGGIPTLPSFFENPEVAWLRDAGPLESTPRGLLNLSTLVFPSLGLGQKARQLLWLEILDGEVADNGSQGQRTVDETWGETLLQELQKRLDAEHSDSKALEHASTLALEPLAHSVPFNIVTLKQVRDAEDPKLACYQSLVESDFRIKKIHDIREMEERIHIRLHRFPSLPFVERLGLVTKKVDWRGSSAVDCLEPVRPFWIKADFEQGLGKTLLLRDEQAQWQPIHLEKGYFEREQARVVEGPLPPLGAAQAVRKVPPQWIIEDVLSREWGQGGSARWDETATAFSRMLSLFRSRRISSDEFDAFVKGKIYESLDPRLRDDALSAHRQLLEHPESDALARTLSTHLRRCSFKPRFCLHKNSLPAAKIASARLWRDLWYAGELS